MPTTGLVEIVNITGLSLYRNLQMLSARGVCALESSSSHMWCVVKSIVRPDLCLLRRSHVALLAYGSIPEVGSSRITISEPPIRAMATLKVQNYG